jgi:hypothetical protein
LSTGFASRCARQVGRHPGLDLVEASWSPVPVSDRQHPRRRIDSIPDEEANEVLGGDAQVEDVTLELADGDLGRYGYARGVAAERQAASGEWLVSVNRPAPDALIGTEN